MAPDIPMIAEKPQLGLVDSANTILTDYTKLFNTELYALNTDFGNLEDKTPPSMPDLHLFSFF